MWICHEIVRKIKRRPTESENIKAELTKNDFADNLPKTIEKLRVDVLIGNDYYTDIVYMRLIEIEITDTLYLLGSRKDGF